MLQHARKSYVCLCLYVCQCICACVEHCAVPSRSHPLQLGRSTPKLTMELPNPFNSPSDDTEGGLSPIGTLFLFSRRIAIVILRLNSGISISWRHAPLHRNCMSKAVLAQRGRDGERERLPRLRRKRDIIWFLCLWVDFFLKKSAAQRYWSNISVSLVSTAINLSVSTAEPDNLLLFLQGSVVSWIT